MLAVSHSGDLWTQVCHPYDISCHNMSFGWLSWICDLIQMSYDNVIMSSRWHTFPFVSHPDEITNFDFLQHGVALQRIRIILLYAKMAQKTLRNHQWIVGTWSKCILNYYEWYHFAQVLSWGMFLNQYKCPKWELKTISVYSIQMPINVFHTYHNGYQTLPGPVLHTWLDEYDPIQ